MKIYARFFALYRERVGQTMVELDLPQDSTVADLVDDVLKRWPDFSPDPSKIVTAANKEYVKHTHVLEDGDEVAFIPPVSGGA